MCKTNFHECISTKTKSAENFISIVLEVLLSSCIHGYPVYVDILDLCHWWGTCLHYRRIIIRRFSWQEGTKTVEIK